MKLRTLALITIFIFSTQIATAQATDLYTLSIIAFDGGTTDPAPEVYLDQSVQTISIRAISDPVTSIPTEPDTFNNDEALINYAIEGKGETAPPFDSLPLEGGDIQ